MSCGRNSALTDALFKILAAKLTGISAAQLQVNIKNWIKPTREPCWQVPTPPAVIPKMKNWETTLYAGSWPAKHRRVLPIQRQR